MMADGLNGVLLVIVVGPREVIAKERGRDIVIRLGNLRKAYVLDPIQRQSIATKDHALVGAFGNREILFGISLTSGRSS